MGTARLKNLARSRSSWSAIAASRRARRPLSGAGITAWDEFDEWAGYTVPIPDAYQYPAAIVWHPTPRSATRSRSWRLISSRPPGQSTGSAASPRPGTAALHPGRRSSRDQPVKVHELDRHGTTAVSSHMPTHLRLLKSPFVCTSISQIDDYGDLT